MLKVKRKKKILDEAWIQHRRYIFLHFLSMKNIKWIMFLSAVIIMLGYSSTWHPHFQKGVYRMNDCNFLPLWQHRDGKTTVSFWSKLKGSHSVVHLPLTNSKCSSAKSHLRKDTASLPAFVPTFSSHFIEIKANISKSYFTFYSWWLN